MKKFRSSGLLMHISSLPSRFGIGDLGPQAYRFADLMADNDQHFWQILPMNPTEFKYGNSPYHSHATFAGNSLFISPELLFQDGLLTKKDLENYILPETSSIVFDRVYSVKKKLFRKVYQNFRSLPYLQQEFEYFCQSQSYWLDDYALFEALRTAYPNTTWNQYPAGLKNRKPESLQTFQKKMAEKIRQHQIIQFIFYRQWNQFRKYCHQKNVSIIGDMPIYVPFNSVDVWAHPDLFKLDENKEPLFQAGVPPDYFSKTGQLWGNPVYQWSTHRKEKFHWWIKRIRHSIESVDLLRIDHFRGLVAYWEIPKEEKTAIKGHWVTGGGYRFFRMLKREFPDLPFIAENLGVITRDVVQVIQHLGLPGMCVLLFGFGDKFPHNTHLPHNYRENSVVYTGTHDNNTVQGWLRKEITRAQKRNLTRYLGRKLRSANAHWDFIRMVQASVAMLAVIPIQDVLGLGEEARMNYPSHADSNWQWHLTTAQMDELGKFALPRLKELTRIYGREKFKRTTPL